MPIERAVFHSSAWVVYWTAPGNITPPPGAPVASFSATPSGTTVAFDASTSYETGGSIVSYGWDFGDGKFSTSSPAPTISHSYASGGTYTATLTVTTADGQKATSSASIKIVIANKPPVSVFTVATSALTVNVNGSGSSDTDGSIVSYDWSFGDGAIATGITASHGYASPGSYTITLKATDNLGSIGTSSKTVSLIAPPTAGFNATIVPSAPASGSFTYADVSHYQGAINWGSYTLPGAIIKLGGSDSGTYTDSAYVTNVTGARAYSKHIAHYWFNGAGDPATDARYFVGALSQYHIEDFLILDVESESGVSGTPWSPAKALTFFQTIRALKPTAKLMIYMSNSVTSAYDWSSVVNYGVKLWDASYGVNDGSRGTQPNPSYWSSYSLWQYTSVGSTGGISGNVDLSYCTYDLFPPYHTVNVDGSTTIGPSPISSYAWTWGDGASSTGKTASHTYSSSGTYAVTLTVVDSVGQSDSITESVAIAADNQPPTARFVSTATNLTVSFDASGSTDPDGTIVRYDWDFGDAAVPVSFTPGTVKPSATNVGAGVIRPFPTGSGGTLTGNQTISSGTVQGKTINGNVTISGTARLLDCIVNGWISCKVGTPFIENCLIQGDGTTNPTGSTWMVNTSASTLTTIQWCTIKNRVTSNNINGIGLRNMLAQYNDVSNVIDCFDIDGGTIGSNGTDCNTRVLCNYLHEMMFITPSAGHSETSNLSITGTSYTYNGPYIASDGVGMQSTSHCDIFQITGDAINPTIKGNTCVANWSATVGDSPHPYFTIPGSATRHTFYCELSVLMLNAVKGLVFWDNWCDYGQVTLNLATKVSGQGGDFRRNKFGRNMAPYGVSSSAPYTMYSNGGATWTTHDGTVDQNVYEDNGTAITIRGAHS